MRRLACFLVLGWVSACSDSGSEADAMNPIDASSSTVPEPTMPSPMAPEPSGMNPGPGVPGDPTSPPANPTGPAGGGAGPVGGSSGGGAGGPSGGGNSVGGNDDPMGLAGAGNPIGEGGGGAGGSAGADTGGDAGSTNGGSPAGGGAGAGGGPSPGGSAGEGAGGADEPPVDATVAVAELSTTGFDDGYDGFSGTATFTQQGDEVVLVLELQGCPAGPHISHIHVNASCDNEGNAAGNHWLPNGELITDYSCEDDGTANYTVTIATDRWTIGSGNSDTDVDGHAFMVHNGSSVSPGDRVACGVIELE